MIHRRKRVCLVVLSAALLLSHLLLLTLPAAADEDVLFSEETAVSNRRTEPARFMSERFVGTDGNSYRVDGDSVTLPVGTGGHNIGYSAVTSPTVYDTPSNAVRFVMTNNSDCTHLNVKYTYDTGSGPRTETQSMTIAARGGRCTYLLRTEYADSLVSMTITIPEGVEGSITLHAMEAVRVYADEATQYGTVQSCTYNSTAKTVRIKGSVYHDVTINAGGGTLGLFALSSGETVEDLLADPTAEPLAQSAISIGFELQASAVDVDARFSRYVVLICMPDGTRFPLAQARYATAEVAGAETDADRSDFKGIDTTLISSAIDSNVGSAIVDVYLNRLENQKNSGYLYTVENEYFYFDRAYLAELDSVIRSLSGAACKVYLRFLVEADEAPLPYAVDISGEGASRYRALRADDSESVRYLYAYTSFLCSRYNGADKGSIAGIIVGKRADEMSVYHAAGEMTLDEYAVTYGRAFSVISLAAQDVRAELAMIVPVSDGWNTDMIGQAHRTDNYTAELFVESIACYLSHCGINPFLLMVESTHNPYGLSNAYFEPVNTDGEDIPEDMLVPRLIAANSDSPYISSENLVLLDTYLACYASLYGSLSDRYFFHWTPDEETGGSALSASYVYHYYRLFTDEKAAGFFVSFREKEGEGNLAEFSKIKYLVKYIDTSSGSYRTSFALDVFGIKSWNELIPTFNRYRTERMTLLEGSFAAPADDLTAGTYTLFDFSTANSTRGWYGGNYCTSLSVRSSEKYGKTLDAVMDADLSTLAEYSDIAYRFETPFNLQYAPYLALDLAVDCAADSDAVFEVKLVIGSDEGYMEAKQVVKNGEMTTLTLNTSYFAVLSRVEYLRLSVKTVMGEDKSFTLHLGGITLASREYETSFLSELIALDLREASGMGRKYAEDDRYDVMLLVIILLTTVLATTVVTVMLGHYQKNNSDDDSDGDGRRL